MYKYVLQLSNGSRFYDFYRRLFACLKGVNVYDEDSEAITVHVTSDAASVIDTILNKSLMSVPFSKSKVSTLPIELIPEHCTIFVVEDKDVYNRLRKRYPKRNVSMIIEEDIDRLAIRYASDEKSAAYILYSNGSYQKIGV